MFETLLLGSFIIVVNMVIQSAFVVLLIRYLIDKDAMNLEKATFVSDTTVIILVLAALLFGHILQFMIWAEVFVLIDEFSDFNTAFYHSIVNFSSLGYGDIVMSEEWRLLGALEACNGVLMFGLSAGTILGIMRQLFKRYEIRT